MNNRYYVFETYMLNSLTGETGWDIKYIGVKADKKSEAKLKIKSLPNFDEIILFNYTDLFNEDCDFIELDSYRWGDIINRITI
jgi:hypothetical protein